MSLKYRPEIDGLRTIAVCSVLIYHAKFSIAGGPAFLRGGFLGVDVFFIISGFLITSLLLQEWQQTGRVSILNFYERRARRLLPALFAVVFVSIPAAWAILMPSAMVEFVQSVIASVFFVSNMFWQQSLLEYGTGPGLEKPFLHTWSLAVEEQFYIFFPLLYLLVLCRITAWAVPVGLIAIAVGLGVAMLTTQLNPTLSFYWVISRLWELLAGAVLAHQLMQNPGFWRTPRALQILPWVALALIVVPLFQSELLKSHPGLVTVPVVLGTVLMIWFASPTHPVVRLLSSRIFAGIGLISYSLYLWHYPIFAFWRVADPGHTTFDKFIWLALSFALAYLSYRFVEVPFRKADIVPARRLVTSMATCAVLTVGFAATMIVQEGRPARFEALMAQYGPAEIDNRTLQRASWDVLADLAAAQGFGPSEAAEASAFEATQLWFDPDGPERKVLILGNSHAKDMFNLFHLNPDLFSDMQVARFGMQANLSDDQIDILLNAPNFQAADTVLIAFSTTNRSIRHMPNLLERLRETDKKLVMLLNSPAFHQVDGRWVFDWYIREHQGLQDPDALEALAYRARDRSQTDRWDAALTELAATFNIPVLRRADYICNEAAQTCDMVTPDGRKVIFDRHHYTVHGARYLGQKVHDMGWLVLLE